MNPHKPILLIEDSPSDIDLTRRALEKGRIGNELIVAEDGEEAFGIHLWHRTAPRDATPRMFPRWY